MIFPFNNFIPIYKNFFFLPIDFGNTMLDNNMNKIKVVNATNSYRIVNNLEKVQDGKQQEMNDKQMKIKETNITEEKKEIEINIKNDVEKKTKLFGRKKANSNQIGIHNKYSDDNLRMKCKHIILSSLMTFINKKIYVLYDGKIGEGILKKKLHIINNKQKVNSIVQYNKDFLDKNLKDIFSEKITSRCTNISRDFNKKLIESLMNEKDEKKKDYFNRLFNLTFRQCLNHFIKKEMVYELIGLETINDVLKDYELNKDYKQCLEYSLKNYEDIILRKKSRKKRKIDKL